MHSLAKVRLAGGVTDELSERIRATRAAGREVSGGYRWSIIGGTRVKRIIALDTPTQ